MKEASSNVKDVTTKLTIINFYFDAQEQGEYWWIGETTDNHLPIVHIAITLTQPSRTSARLLNLNNRESALWRYLLTQSKCYNFWQLESHGRTKLL